MSRQAFRRPFTGGTSNDSTDAKYLRNTLFLLLAIAMVISAAPLAAQGRVLEMPPCQVPGNAVEIDLGTGSYLAPGLQDPRWDLISIPPNQPGPFPTWTTIPYSSWVAATPPRQWIHRIQHWTPSSDSAGNYAYRIRFNINPTLYTNLKITGGYAADNSASVSLNGIAQTSCPGSTCFQSLHALNITSGFVNGINTLQIVVNNASGPTPTGLLVQAKLEGTCRGGGSCIWPPAGMSAWWSMDETGGNTAADLQGGSDAQSLPAAISAATGPSTVGGMVDGALGFANGARLRVPSSSVLQPGTGDFSIDSWVLYQAAGSGNSLNIVSKYATSSPGYSLHVVDSSPTQGLVRFVVNGPSSAPVLTGAITPNVWHHVAATLDRSGGGMVLYVDGAPASGGPVGAGGSVSNALDLLIGGDGVTPGFIALDEVELFNRALSASEVQALSDALDSGKCKCTPPPAGMTAWWPLDELTGTQLADIAGSNAGVSSPGPVGSTGPSPVPGRVNGSLQFNGSSHFVEVADAAALDFGSGDLTIDAWIRVAPPATGIMPIADKQTPGPTDIPYGYSFFLRDGHLAFAMTSGPAGAYASIAGEDPASIADSNWHHVAVTVRRNPASANGGTLIVDGTAVATFSTLPSAGTSADNDAPLILGSRNRLFRGPVTEFFGGAMDEVEVFKRALTVQEIRRIHHAGSRGKCRPACASAPASLVAWWPFDEPSGSTSILDVWSSLHGSPVPSPVGFPGPASRASEYVSNSLYFVASHVDVPPSAQLNFGTGELSIDAWIHTLPGVNNLQIPVLYGIVDRMAVSGSNGTGYALYLYAPPGQAPRLAFTLASGGAINAPTTHPASFSGGWHHVAMTLARPGGNTAIVTLYVDGVPASTTIPSLGNISSSSSLLMGRSRLDPLFGGTHGTEFALDEIEIFDGALTAAEVMALYRADVAGKCRALQARICVTQYLDLNRDGIRDEGEPWQGGGTVRVSSGDAAVGSIITRPPEGAGPQSACLNVEAPGTYSLSLEVPLGSMSTTQNPLTVVVTAGDTFDLTFARALAPRKRGAER